MKKYTPHRRVTPKGVVHLFFGGKALCVTVFRWEDTTEATEVDQGRLCKSCEKYGNLYISNAQKLKEAWGL